MVGLPVPFVDFFRPANGQIIAAVEFSLGSLSEKKIWEDIYTTHAFSDETLDDHYLFTIVENIIKSATQYVGIKVQDNNQMDADDIEEITPRANFSVPLCTLKGILCGMQCKSRGDEIAHKATVAILKKVSKYSWVAKASLTLAAFAMEYGEFWLLEQVRESNPLAKSIAILKRVPVLLRPSELARRRLSVIELNDLIKITLQVIKCIDTLSEYSKRNYDLEVVCGLSEALKNIPCEVYWVINTVVACANKITILTSDEDEEYSLAFYSQKMNVVHQNIRTQLTRCDTQIAVEATYIRIRNLFRHPTEIVVVLKALINVRPSVDIDIITGKNVLLFISKLDNTAADIEILQRIHEYITENHNTYMIVWVPIVEEWTDGLIREFDIMKQKMPWLFTLQLSGHIAGIKYIKKDWNFKGEPMMVVMNPHGIVQHFDALNMIRVWGVQEAFPYTKGKEEELSAGQGRKWIPSVFEGTRHPYLLDWIRAETYIIFYGGRDSLWIREFEAKARALESSPILEELGIQLHFVYVGKARKGEDIDDYGLLDLFWGGVESLFLIEGQTESVTKDIHKLLSYKNENGWAVLSRGPTAVVICHGEPVSMVVEESEKWRETIGEGGSFGLCFENYYKTIVSNPENLPCCRLDISSRFTGKVQQSMSCPDCHRAMKSFIAYKCCHDKDPLAHH